VVMAGARQHAEGENQARSISPVYAAKLRAGYARGRYVDVIPIAGKFRFFELLRLLRQLLDPFLSAPESGGRCT